MNGFELVPDDPLVVGQALLPLPLSITGHVEDGALDGNESLWDMLFNICLGVLVVVKFPPLHLRLVGVDFSSHLEKAGEVQAAGTQRRWATD